VFDTLRDLLAGGASAVEMGRRQEDNGGRVPGSVFWARQAHDAAARGEPDVAAWLFGVAGEREGRHNHRWF
jgi:hypothetical protein